MTGPAARRRARTPGARALAARAIRLFRRQSYARALALLRRAAAADPRNSSVLRFYAAQSLFELGAVGSALRGLRLVARDPDPAVRRAVLEKIAVCVPGDPAANNARILADRRRWGRLLAREEPARATDGWRLIRGRRLRVGYVSAFLSRRNWMKPVWGVLGAHDRRSFEIHLFLDGGLPRRRHGFPRRPSDRIHRLDGLSNRAAADLVAEAGIDVLVDLNGYSHPSRLGLFARRPAPAQLGWFAAYSTSGLAAFDAVIADRTALPARERRFCSEKVLYVRGTYLPFEFRYRVPGPSTPPCARRRPFTFGCLAPLYKINAEVVSAFAAILRAAPGARLLLKNARMADAGCRDSVRSAFRRQRIAPDRLLLEGPAEHFAFLRAYGRVDVALDTFPYSGGTTTAEALWQGVPVLTVAGDRWAARTTASILKAAGLGEWVRASRDSFIRRAVALARGRETAGSLAILRADLRRRLRGSPACDVRGLCRQLEHHYQAVARGRLPKRPAT